MPAGRIAAMIPTRQGLSAWTVGLKPLLPVALLAGAALVAFRPSMDALAVLWSDPYRRTYEHGYLIAAIVAWLIFRERHHLASVTARPSATLLAAGLAGSLAWAVAVRAGVQTAHLVIWPLALWCAAGGMLGWKAARVLAFPMACLYLAMPVWEPLLPWLQHATVVANRVLIGLSGIPAWVEGSSVHLAAGTFAIDVRCSGLSYLVSGVSLAVLLGQINRDSLRRRWLLVLLAGGLALISNWLRVFVVIVAGHLTDMQHYFVQVDHIGLGWVLFGIVFLGFFLLVRSLPHAGTPGAPPPSPLPANKAAPALILAGVAALVAGPALLQATDRTVSGPVGIAPVAAAGWAGPMAGAGDWRPVFKGADAEMLAEYVRGPDRVSAYAATYLRQEQGQELTGFGNSIHGRAEGRPRAAERRLGVTTGAATIPVAASEWTGVFGDRALLWRTYQVGGRLFSSGLPAQVWYGIASLTSAPVSSVVVLRAECLPDCDAARDALGRFAAAALPALLDAAGQSDRIGGQVSLAAGTGGSP